MGQPGRREGRHMIEVGIGEQRGRFRLGESSSGEDNHNEDSHRERANEQDRQAVVPLGTSQRNCAVVHSVG